MVRFGGNEFTSFSVPLVFGGRYFILEPSDPPMMSIFIEVDGQPVFEVLKNVPGINPMSNVSVSGAGIITVSDKNTGRFLYKIRPGSETSVVFGKLDGGKIDALITDTMVKVGSLILKNNTFSGIMVGIRVDDNGGISIGSPLPECVKKIAGI